MLICFQSMLPLSQEPENSHSHETQHDPSQNDRSKDSGKSISIQNTQLEEVVIVNEQISNNRKVDTSNAAWALGSFDVSLCNSWWHVDLHTAMEKQRPLVENGRL